MRLFKPIRIAAPFAALALAVLGTGQAWAAGTAANVDVTNNVSLDFTVNNVAQTQQNASATFKVDRKLVVAVSSNDADYVSATPGATSTMSFNVTNQSNNEAADPLGLVFAVVRKTDQVTGFTNTGLAAAGAADGSAFTVRVTINGTTEAVTADANGVFSITGHSQYTGGLDADEAITVLVDAPVDADAANNDYQSFTVVASLANAAGTVFSTDDSGNAVPGATPAAAVADGAGTVEDVFADLASAGAEDTGYTFGAGTPNANGTQDAASNNQSSDTSGVRVAAAAIALTKTAEVLWDPVSGNKYDAAGAATGDLPKAIPGAVVMYVVAVKNGATGVTEAFDIAISDTVPAQMDNGNQAGEAVNLPASSASGLDTLSVPFVSGTSYAVADADTTVRVKSCRSSTFDTTDTFANLATGITVNPASGGAGTGCGDGNGTFEDADYAIYVYLMTVQ